MVSVALDAVEFDPYYTVVKAVDEARTADVVTFAAALNEFGLTDMAAMTEQARRRLAALDRLDELLLNPATREQEMHTALEHNLWVLGADYALLASNRTLRAVIGQYTGERFTGKRAAKRPDLLLLGGISNRHVLIEFKRPSLDITREHEAQATQYRDDLRTRFDGIEVIVIGRARASDVDVLFQPTGFSVMSYAAVVSRARSELSWLLNQLTDGSNERTSDIA